MSAGRSALIALVLLCAACGPAPTAVSSAEAPAATATARTIPSPTPFPTPEPATVAAPATTVGTPTPTPSPAPTPSAARTPSPQPPALARYDLEATVDIERRTAQVSQTITYVNTQPEPLRDFVLVVDPARVPGTFTLLNLAVDGAPIGAPARAPGTLSFRAPAPLAPGAVAHISVRFDLRIPQRADRFGATARQINFGDWFPFVPPYAPGRGWQVREPPETGEYLLREPADHVLALTLTGAEAAGWVLAVGGTFARGGARAEVRLPHSRGLDWSISRDYRVTTRAAGGYTVESYYFPEHARSGAAVADAALRALQLYSELFTPYARTRLVAVESEFPDGMEYDGLFFLGREYYAGYAGAPDGYLTALAAHETAHQWWSMAVGNDPALEPWLDEALSAYCELLYYERPSPPLGAWWWRFRVEHYNPAGAIDQSAYAFNAFRPYVNAVYLRGALYLQALRTRMGDPRFFAFLRDYAATQSGRIATRADFAAALRRQLPAGAADIEREFFK